MNRPELSEVAKRRLFLYVRSQQRTRFYIAFNCRGSFIPDHEGPGAPYVRYVWPILFKTRELAEQAMRVLPIFANREAIPGRGRIVSATVEKVTRRE